MRAGHIWDIRVTPALRAWFAALRAKPAYYWKLTTPEAETLIALLCDAYEVPTANKPVFDPTHQRELRQRDCCGLCFLDGRIWTYPRPHLKTVAHETYHWIDFYYRHHHGGPPRYNSSDSKGYSYEFAQRLWDALTAPYKNLKPQKPAKAPVRHPVTTDRMTTPPDQRIRVRALLGLLNSVERAELKKLLPRGVATHPPEEPEGTKYPAALLAQLAAAQPSQQYALAGHITEALLRLRPIDVTTDRLCAVAQEWCPALTPLHLSKIVASKTTEPYLTHIRETRKKVRFLAVGDMAFEPTIHSERVEGHPDIRTPTQIFEIKMTGQLKQNWVDFLFQTFAYAALEPAITHVHIVLPLQEIVWAHDVGPTGWPKRAEYRAFLEEAATKKDTTGGTQLAALLLINAHRIGSHQSKLKSLPDTIRSFPANRPAQIFLAGPQSARLQIADAELAATAAATQETDSRWFIHSPYIINLCTPPGEQDDYHTALLRKNLRYGVAAGAHGVVVHVGKSTKQDLPTALAHMRTNTLIALQDATETCPLLLETPAGQGTEVLTKWSEFAAFVAEINDPRLRICIDTCHVFACGADPHTYLTDFLTTHPTMTKLIHFNDSATPCGSCLDRHAFCGQGHIGLEKMTAIATAASSAGLPLVIE
jgi:deoxyribonuclease IV